MSYKGHSITAMSPNKICRLGIGRTFQIPQPFINLTALENVSIAGEYGCGLRKAAADKQAHEILEMVDLLEKKDSLTKDLAAVTLKRLELARALATDPDLLLLDEVAAGLTEEETPNMLKIFKRLRETGVTYIMIEHVMRVMTQAVDRIIVIDKGSMIAQGTPDKVMADKIVIEAYLGETKTA